MITLYAIVAKRPRRALGNGMGGRTLTLVRAGGAHVVVERADPKDPTPRALRHHDRIVKRIATATTAVLPFRFGSHASDAASLRAMLEPVSAAVAKALELVDGCVQYTLRVYGDVGRSAPAPSEKGAEGGPGTRWLGVRLRKRRVPEIDAVTTATAPYVKAARAERHDRPPLIASVYQLVSKEQVRPYRLALRRAARDLAEVEVRSSGPFPPYAFAELS